MIQRFAILFFTICCFSCKQKPAANPEKEDQPFFPLAPYIAQQIKILDSLNLPVIQVVIEGGDTSSRITTRAELKQAAQDFTSPDITEPPLKSRYAEASFADQSIPNITLTYSATDKTLPVQRLDVILQPDPIGSDKVKTIYLEKISGDTAKKLLWSSDVSFQIISTTANGSKIVKFDWSSARSGN